MAFSPKVIVALLGGWRATVFAVLALASTGAAWWQWSGKMVAQGALAELQMDQLEEDNKELQLLFDIYVEKQKVLAKIGEEHEQALADAERKRLDVVDDLRTAKLKLRDHWTCPASPSSPGKLDEETRLREEAAGRIVQIGAQADAQILGLQQVIEELLDGK